MAVELSCIKGSVSAAALELDLSHLAKWRMDPRFNGGNLLPKNDKLSPEEQELRELKKRLKESELENAILKKGSYQLFQGRLKVYWIIKKDFCLFDGHLISKIISNNWFFR